jgi:hypothetical protein
MAQLNHTSRLENNSVATTPSANANFRFKPFWKRYEQGRSDGCWLQMCRVLSTTSTSLWSKANRSDAGHLHAMDKAAKEVLQVETMQVLADAGSDNSEDLKV